MDAYGHIKLAGEHKSEKNSSLFLLTISQFLHEGDFTAWLRNPES